MAFEMEGDQQGIPCVYISGSGLVIWFPAGDLQSVQCAQSPWQ